MRKSVAYGCRLISRAAQLTVIYVISAVVLTLLFGLINWFWGHGFIQSIDMHLRGLKLALIWFAVPVTALGFVVQSVSDWIGDADDKLDWEKFCRETENLSISDLWHPAIYDGGLNQFRKSKRTK